MRLNSSILQNKALRLAGEEVQTCQTISPRERRIDNRARDRVVISDGSLRDSVRGQGSEPADNQRVLSQRPAVDQRPLRSQNDGD